MARARQMTEEAVLKIRQLRSRGKSYQELSAMFGCSRATAHHIATGKSYKDIGGPIAEIRPMISAEEAEEILAAYRKGASTTSLSLKHDRSFRTIRLLCKAAGTKVELTKEQISAIKAAAGRGCSRYSLRRTFSLSDEAISIALATQ